MKIILLNGSPRMKGNTKVILNTLVDGIRENKSSHEVEIIDVARKNIKPCLACDVCGTNGGKCIQKDDTNELIERLTLADMIVFATPVYWWGMSAQLKLVVDKMYCDQGLLKGKKIGVIAVGAAELSDPQYRLISEQFNCIGKLLNWKIIFSEGYSANKAGEIVNNQELMNRVLEIGKSI